MARGPLVLLVDDEFAILAVVTELLQSEGYEVVTAADGEAAVESLRARTPDVVILDVMLPRRSGPDVVRIMRADPGLAHVPVLLMTAVPWSVDADVAHECLVIHKPFSVERMLGALDELLRTAGGKR